MPGSRRWLAPVACAIALAAAGCSEEYCTRNSECETGFVCTREALCEPAPDASSGPDAGTGGVDGGVPDGAQPDAAADGGVEDAGPEIDASDDGLDL